MRINIGTARPTKCICGGVIPSTVNPQTCFISTQLDHGSIPKFACPCLLPRRSLSLAYVLLNIAILCVDFLVLLLHPLFPVLPAGSALDCGHMLRQLVRRKYTTCLWRSPFFTCVVCYNCREPLGSN